MGFDVFSDSLKNIDLNSSRAKTLNTISPNSYGISSFDLEFRRSLMDSDYLVLDGVYFSLASIILSGRNITKNQGPDVFRFFMQKMNVENGRVFFLGSSQATLDKIAINLRTQYSNICAEYMSPPFRANFSCEEEALMIEKINDFQPDIVFVGMTCPKQEKWANKNRDKLNTKLICSIGAVFDWYAGNQKDIHPLWWKLRLGWLKRTIDRPEILKRYPNIGIFFWHLLLTRIGWKTH
ncbi:WecB/TagA/CpsF family glycosyltransferase [Schleiferiaceae bacterium]|nr:WecB/TagA/CpsF family glycosyltransferase [Schleiferiaceae bacterium]